MSPLHEAAVLGKIDTVKFLLSRFNADLEARDGVSVTWTLLILSSMSLLEFKCVVPRVMHMLVCLFTIAGIAC